MTTLCYPTLTHDLSFADYITQCRNMIIEKRRDLSVNAAKRHLIIDANTPFELYPSQSAKPLKYGALLIHGLLDCPFSLKDIGRHLQAQGVLCRSILLPGHGTIPDDLLSVTYQDWIEAMQYGIASLQQEVEQVFLIGYSTGAALALYHTLTTNRANTRLVLLSPAIRVKTPISLATAWRSFLHRFDKNNSSWLTHTKESDYTKYHSIPVNAVVQVEKLSQQVQALNQQAQVQAPLLMIMSREDETVSSQEALGFFSELDNPHNQMLLYTPANTNYADKRIMTHSSAYPKLGIKHFSHSAIPFAADNSHYGQEGDYPLASHLDEKNIYYGAYNPLEIAIHNVFFHLALAKRKYRDLTYNPDFEFMAKTIEDFLLH